jgi:hypothetical protein
MAKIEDGDKPSHGGTIKTNYEGENRISGKKYG